MIYSNRIAVRLARFAMGNTLIDGTVIDPVAVLDPSFANAGCLCTVNWTVAPTAQRCVPEGPYLVEMATDNSEVDHSGIAAFEFSRPNAHTLDVNQLFGRPLPGWGAIAVGFSISSINAAADTQFYATDFLGEELHGTRRQAVLGQPCVLFGPGIFAIRATGNVSVKGVVALVVPVREISFTLLAEVGPAFEPATRPVKWPYDGQSYLSNTGLLPSQALALRQTADSLARQTIKVPDSPHSSTLETKVHRRKPMEISDDLDQLEVLREAAEHLADIRKNPFWSYKADGATTGGGKDKLAISVGPMLQLMARVGPVEALTLGQAVTVPISGQLFPAIDDQSAAYNRIQTGQLPFPLIRVRGQFYDNLANAVIEEFGFAGLELPIAERLFDSAKQTDPRRPQTLDGVASADIEIALAKNASAQTYFLATGEGDKEIVLGRDGWPKTYLTETSEPSVGNAAGQPSLRHGPVELPKDKPWRDQPLLLYPRDMFGRWPAADNGTCRLRPWPVGAPGLLSSLIEYVDDHSVGIRIAVQWDRTMRRQADISFGIRLIATKPNDRTALETPFKPTDGVKCPAFPSGGNLAIAFDADGNPSIKFDNPPKGLGVNLVKSTSEPDTVAGPATPKLQLYELTVPLGPAVALMALLTDAAGRLFVQIVADASEKVSGDRRTDSPLPRLTKQIDDPRAPVLVAERWRIFWTGLPNGTTGEARALLALPSAGGVPAPESYYAWQAHETAVLEFVLGWEFPDDDTAVTRLLAVIRREHDMPARLALFQYLIEKNLADPAFKQGFTGLFRASFTERIPAGEKQVEIVLPAHQTGFEFVIFTAVSAAGIETPKDPSVTLRILAVPSRRPISAPSLRIITTDDTGLLEASGLCLAIVSHLQPFEAGAVRFFWGAGDIADANSLLSTLTPVSEFTMEQAAAYVFNIEEIVKKGVSLPHVRLFLLKPSRTRDRHHFAVDIRSANGTSASDQIPSPRSQVQSHFLSV